VEAKTMAKALGSKSVPWVRRAGLNDEKGSACVAGSVLSRLPRKSLMQTNKEWNSSVFLEHFLSIGHTLTTVSVSQSLPSLPHFLALLLLLLLLLLFEFGCHIVKRILITTSSSLGGWSTFFAYLYFQCNLKETPGTSSWFVVQVGWCQQREKIDWQEAGKFDCWLVQMIFIFLLSLDNFHKTLVSSQKINFDS